MIAKPSVHVVFVSYNYWPPDFGGELLLSIERLHALVERGFDITVLTAGRPGFAQRQVDGKICIHRSPVVGNGHPARLLRRIIFVLWTVWYILRLPMDVLHIGDLPGIGPVSSALTVWLWAALAKLRRAYAVSAHALADSTDVALKTDGWKGWWRSSQFRVLDRVISNSPALHQAVELAMPGKSVLIVNGVRDDFICHIDAETRKTLRTQAGILREEDVVFVFEGSVGLRKGFDTLAAAFAALAATHTHWHLWVIGPYTSAGSQNIDLAEVHTVTQPVVGLQTQVSFLGRIDDRLHLRDLLCAADVFVFPSRREGLGVAPLEAMATGLPVIISRIPNVTDLGNVEGETGLFIQPGNIEGLKQAMLQLGESRVLRQGMGAAARERILKFFSWAVYLKKWEDLYRRESV